ncbi:hypothetical protein [Ralstonia pseudosolanacearum]|nr:hypothetical protein [Ralstonia pseudosolanacearum]MDO3517735.1 hypothetical protein [Ralstonia pseudosolanacearum]
MALIAFICTYLCITGASSAKTEDTKGLWQIGIVLSIITLVAALAR